MKRTRRGEIERGEGGGVALKRGEGGKRRKGGMERGVGWRERDSVVIQNQKRYSEKASL